MKFPSLILFLFISTFGFSHTAEKKILFQGDSLWYAAENQMLFSSTDKGKNWDTIFANRNQTDTTFFNGALDTATNIFISDQQTLFVFGWDGTKHFNTILYCSSDYGKSWSKNTFQSINGVVGVKYFHKSSADKFFLYLRNGYYVISVDAGKTWKKDCVVESKFGCFDDRFITDEDGTMRIGFSPDKYCKKRAIMYSFDGGNTWVRGK